MKTQGVKKIVRAIALGLMFGVGFASQQALALSVPTVRHYGYINGTLNLALVASDEVKAAGASVEVEASADGGETWSALAGAGSVITAFNAWTIDNGGSSNLTLTDYHWKSAAPLSSDILLRYRLVNGAEESDWSSSLSITRSVAAHPQSVTATTGADKLSLASDGDINTSYAGATPASVVYDFGKAVAIGEIRLAAKLGYVCRLRTMKIECAETSDFANARTLVEFVNWQDVCSKMGVPFRSGSYSVDFSNIAVTSFEFGEPVTARYFRIGRPTGPGWKADLNGTGKYDDRDDGGTFNLAEVEFSLADPTAVTIDSVEVGPAATTPIPYADRTPVVAWSLGGSRASSVTVERGTSAEGPFFPVATDLAADATSWSDASALVGVTYYYRVKALSVEAEPRAFYSSVVAHTRDRRLERDPANLVGLKTGVTLVGTYNSHGNEAFDGNIATMPYTISSGFNGSAIWNHCPNPYIGVNFGELCHITGCLVLSQTDTSITSWFSKGSVWSRINKVDLWGTTNNKSTESVDGRWPGGVDGSAGRTKLAEIRGVSEGVWAYFKSSNEDAVFRCAYLQNASAYSATANADAAQTWAGNVSELGFFGYSDAERTANYAALVTAPATFTAVCDATGVVLTWDAGNNAAGYRVQRRPASVTDDAVWSDISETLYLYARTFTDDTCVAGLYEYRVVALDGAGMDAGYSASASVFAYPRADGTGLRATYIWPFVQNGFDATESVRSDAVETPVLSFADGAARIAGLPESVSNVRVVYEGKIVIPVAGLYQFRAVGTDGAALRLDGHYIFNAWNAADASRTTVSAARRLEAGEHDFRFDTWQGAGDRTMSLEWSLEETAFEPIPASQLKPAAKRYVGTVAVPFADGKSAVWNVRTFGQKELGLAASDLSAKSLVIGGYDTAGMGNGLGQTAVFTKFKGPFDLSVKIDFPGSPDNAGVKGLASADADAIFTLSARTGFGAGTLGYGPFAEWYGYRGDARLGVGVLYKNATDWGPNATGQSTSWWNYKPSALAADDAHDTWLRLRLVRDINKEGQTVFSSYFKKGSSDAWTHYSTWTDTEGLFDKTAYICLGATRKPHATLSADTTRFLVREVKFKPLHQGLVIIFR